MATVALTNIHYGKPDGSRVEIDALEPVKKSDFPDDVWEDLKEAGAVGPPPVAPEDEPSVAELQAENDDLAAQVKKLEAQHAAAKAQSAKTETPKTPSTQTTDKK